MTQETLFKPFWNLAGYCTDKLDYKDRWADWKYSFGKKLRQIGSWVLQVIEYVHNNPKSDFNIFGVYVGVALTFQHIFYFGVLKRKYLEIYQMRLQGANS